MEKYLGEQYSKSEDSTEVRELDSFNEIETNGTMYIDDDLFNLSKIKMA